MLPLHSPHAPLRQHRPNLHRDWRAHLERQHSIQHKWHVHLREHIEHRQHESDSDRDDGREYRHLHHRGHHGLGYQSGHGGDGNTLNLTQLWEHQHDAELDPDRGKYVVEFRNRKFSIQFEWRRMLRREPYYADYRIEHLGYRYPDHRLGRVHDYRDG